MSPQMGDMHSILLRPNNVVGINPAIIQLRAMTSRVAPSYKACLLSFSWCLRSNQGRPLGRPLGPSSSNTTLALAVADLNNMDANPVEDAICGRYISVRLILFLTNRDCHWWSSQLGYSAKCFQGRKRVLVIEPLIVPT